MFVGEHKTRWMCLLPLLHVPLETLKVAVVMRKMKMRRKLLLLHILSVRTPLQIPLLCMKKHPLL
jgi:hypothetical protein